MPRFAVTITTDPAIESHYVDADYVKLEGGHLIFRNHAQRGKGDGYPQMVEIIAPGAWTACMPIVVNYGLGSGIT